MLSGCSHCYHIRSLFFMLHEAVNTNVRIHATTKIHQIIICRLILISGIMYEGGCGGGQNSESERTHKSQVVRKLERATLMEEISWRQKIKGTMVKGVGQVWRFFHQVANLLGRNNAIKILMVDRAVSSDLLAIKNEFYSVTSIFLQNSMHGDRMLMD